MESATEVTLPSVHQQILNRLEMLDREERGLVSKLADLRLNLKRAQTTLSKHRGAQAALKLLGP
jgi:hypothetical protein